tara:strand:- start:374 stop:784 length:411 start_codon:yes stop_codon:yes gene_type:complete
MNLLPLIHLLIQITTLDRCDVFVPACIPLTHANVEHVFLPCRPSQIRDIVVCSVSVDVIYLLFVGGIGDIVGRNQPMNRHGFASFPIRYRDESVSATIIASLETSLRFLVLYNSTRMYEIVGVIDDFHYPISESIL